MPIVPGVYNPGLSVIAISGLAIAASRNPEVFMAAQMQGKVALVTGGGSGIGRAAAIAFARAGARVVIGDVVSDGGGRTVELIKDTGGEALFRQTDVSVAHQVEQLVKAAVETYGGLDCAYNNAGIEGPACGLLEYKEEDWHRVIAVNLTGVYLCLKHEIPAMIARGGGAIVNTSSVMGLVGAASIPAYIASKHGVAGLTREAALEFAKSKIRVNAVCPGAIQTPMIERTLAAGLSEKDLVAPQAIPRLGKPEEIAAAVVWLCSDAASFVTGVTMPVDGGWMAQ
jgi:NAD(P)-dependent dehydrogenase (short-subunit alcohol dehydrogenase family)